MPGWAWLLIVLVWGAAAVAVGAAYSALRSRDDVYRAIAIEGKFLRVSPAEEDGADE